jgi:hypothetical protein
LDVVRDILNPTPSLDWRRTLDSVGDNTAQRRASARSHLTSAPKGYTKLIESNEAMNLLCEKVSSCQGDGNEAAQPNIASDTNSSTDLDEEESLLAFFSSSETDNAFSASAWAACSALDVLALFDGGPI